MIKNYKVVITGAESTGKSAVSRYLANYFDTIWLPEFARDFVENLNRPYIYEDVEFIAKTQINQEANMLKKANKFLFIDTSLIITKIWFKVVYNKIPNWLEEKICETKPNFYLLCNNDLEWIPDKVRENGGEMRQKLFDMYLAEIINYSVDYEVIKGVGEQRFLNAVSAVKNYFE
ncbi:MAG: ATP-binding protein [Bacteroidales bacterium]|nr:ATP-binding protein [Bacteroidales bacterium]